jgi:hypothetical protein
MIAKISRLWIQLAFAAGFAVGARVRLAADDGIGQARPVQDEIGLRR